MGARQRMERYAGVQMVQQVIAVVVGMDELTEHAAERVIAAEPDQAPGLQAHVIGDLAERCDSVEDSRSRGEP